MGLWLVTFHNESGEVSNNFIWSQSDSHVYSPSFILTQVTDFLKQFGEYDLTGIYQYNADIPKDRSTILEEFIEQNNLCEGLIDNIEFLIDNDYNYHPTRNFQKAEEFLNQAQAMQIRARMPQIVGLQATLNNLKALASDQN